MSVNAENSCNSELNCSCGGNPQNRLNLPSYRPRGSLARALYEKHLADDYLNTFDKNEWYKCDLDQFPEEISSRFIQLGLDEDTKKFLQLSEEKSDWIMTQIWHSVMKTVLGFFMTQTSINGWLQRGSMFVISYEQFLTLLGETPSWKSEALLDLGAGDGEVTAYLAKSFERVYVTEISNTMQTLLKRKGYEVLSIDGWHQNKKYNVIACLNLLDRCDKPLELLQQIKNSLTKDGKVLLALVLPFSPYVESGSSDHRPKEKLPIKGQNFEQQVTCFIDNVLIPEGFEIISWSRVPYLCEGDLRQSYYWLDDVIMVLKVKN